MKPTLILAAALALAIAPPAPRAQEAVVGVANPDSLFTSPDPRLNANKQAAYHIVKDLIEAGHWEQADRWLTPQYHQHNPNAASGRDGVVAFFTKVLKVSPKPIPERMATPIAAVIAEGDLVVVVYPRPITDPKEPAKAYTTSGFDMWRFKDGKADEHWDGATRD